MTTDRPSFEPPRAPQLPSPTATTTPTPVPAPTPKTASAGAPGDRSSIRRPEPPKRKRRRPSVVGVVVTSVLVVGALVFAVVVATSLLFAPDHDRAALDQPYSAAADNQAADPLDQTSNCEDDFTNDVTTIVDDIGVKYEGADCSFDGEVVVSLGGRYSRARLVSVAQQLLSGLYNDGWDVERVEVYDRAGTSAYDSW